MPSMADISIPIGREHAYAVLHDVANATAAVVMVGGAGRGTWGPAGAYPRLDGRLDDAGIAALRLDYRAPDPLRTCVEDTRAARTSTTARASGAAQRSMAGVYAATSMPKYVGAS